MLCEDLSCERGCENEVVVFGTGEAENFPGNEHENTKGKYWHYGSKYPSVGTDEKIPLVFLDGDGDISRDGSITLPEGRYTVFRSFQCASVGNLKSVYAAMNINGAERKTASSVKTIYNTFTQAFGADMIDITQGESLYFTVRGEQKARIELGFFDILIIAT